MGAGYLLDTNVIVDYLSQKLPLKSTQKVSNLIDKTPKISGITKIELLGVSRVSVEIVDFARAALIISLEENIVQKAIDLRKQYKLKLPDAIIAATALVYNLTLITHNTRDFQHIKHLKIVDSHSLA